MEIACSSYCGCVGDLCLLSTHSVLSIFNDDIHYTDKDVNLVLTVVDSKEGRIAHLW